MPIFVTISSDGVSWKRSNMEQAGPHTDKNLFRLLLPGLLQNTEPTMVSVTWHIVGSSIWNSKTLRFCTRVCKILLGHMFAGFFPSAICKQGNDILRQPLRICGAWTTLTGISPPDIMNDGWQLKGRIQLYPYHILVKQICWNTSRILW